MRRRERPGANCTPPEGEGVWIEPVDGRLDLLEAYDALPAELRAMIQTAPFQATAISVLRLWQDMEHGPIRPEARIAWVQDRFAEAMAISLEAGEADWRMRA